MTYMTKAINRFNKTMAVCEPYQYASFKPTSIDDLINETKCQISFYYENGHVLNDLRYENYKEWNRRVQMLKRLLNTLNDFKKSEENEKFYERLKRTINAYFQNKNENIILDSEGNKLYYIRVYDWVFASWDKKHNVFNGWQIITPSLIDELFDENNKLREEFKLGYYDLFAEWRKNEIKILGKKISQETQEGKNPLSEATLKRLLGC